MASELSLSTIRLIAAIATVGILRWRMGAVAGVGTVRTECGQNLLAKGIIATGGVHRRMASRFSRRISRRKGLENGLH